MRILFYQCHKGLELFRIHFRCGEAGGLALQSRFATSCCQDVRVGLGVHDRDFLLRLVKSADYFAAEIIFPGQSTQALAGTIAYFGGVGAKKAWPIDDFAADDRVILAEMMPFDTIAPRPVV